MWCSKVLIISPQHSCQADAAIGTILLENPAKDDPLVDTSWLVSVLRDVAHTFNRLLQDAKMKLTLAGQVILKNIGDLDEVVIRCREEDLCCPASWLE